MKAYDVIIIGGGLSGLTAALHLAQNQIEVLVIEKQTFPHHKVCGEYLSREVKPYLDALGISLPNPVNINTLQVSIEKGTSLNTRLPLGGLGISRYALDSSLYRKAVEKGVTFVFETVTTVTYTKNQFNLATTNGHKFRSEILIGAYGKRASLDKQLERKFIKTQSPWLAVKAHYACESFPDDLVALHNFKGGYAGLSKTETGAINFCYLANYKYFKDYKDIKNFNNQVVAKNPYLGEFLRTSKPLFDQPLTIAQISFERKRSVERHMLMCGDTAGLIHPLCGNGMAMAIHSAKIASELIIDYFNEHKQRQKLEREYTYKWRTNFSKRLATGRRLQAALLNPFIADKLMQFAIKSPRLLESVIRRTHGKILTA